MQKTVCELFAGVGGFRLGLQHSSPHWETVWFSQWEPGRKKQWAHDCYVKHWGDIDERTGQDIASVDKTAIPDHTLLVGGFPCQNYSVAASKSSKGIEGEKGALWWSIRDTLIAKRPPFVLLENVDRLLKSPASQRGRDFGVMLTCFAQLGYSVEWRVVNAADYGAAQRRRRIFIFACNNRTRHGAAMGLCTAEDLLLQDGFFAHAFPCTIDGSLRTERIPFHDLSNVDPQTLLTTGDEDGNNDLLDISRQFAFPFENSGFMMNGIIHTCSTVPVHEPPIELRQIAVQDADQRYYISDESMGKWVYLKGAKRIDRVSKSGHAYVFSEGPIAFPDPLDRPSRTMLTSESSLNRSTHVIADPVTGRLRLLTPVEAERLQGFDDEWTNTGMPEKFRYFCMGNALVVPMIERMGTVLNKIIEAEP